MARNRVDFSVEGMNELRDTLREVGQLPQKCVTKAARKGAAELLRDIKQAAPVDSGDLRRGLVIKAEKRTKKGKRVYQIVFNNQMNDVFVSISKEGKRGYYPASMEYGYLTVAGNYIPGYRFMRKTADANDGKVKSTILTVLLDELDKLE